MVTGGVYLEIEPHSRLVFSWGEPDADPAEAPTITLTLAPDGASTLLTLRLQGVDEHPGDGFFHDGGSRPWTPCPPTRAGSDPATVMVRDESPRAAWAHGLSSPPSGCRRQGVGVPPFALRVSPFT